ncbi:MAG: DUF4389 domain-containing protein [Bacteroidetes bacterium]|jgi:hypothetical protein|nr:DUF4389 domain-containing protein [Bacteroidota bacterium]
MNFHIEQQETYSRGELLLRNFLGFLYIMIPHLLVSFCYGLVLMVIGFIRFFSILITGKFPRNAHNAMVQIGRYNLRLTARIFNLRDGYPPFTLETEDEGIIFDMPYVENVNRGRLLIRTLFGGLLLIPHIFIVGLRIYGVMFANIYAFFMVLFTKKFPDGVFKFSVETFRWNYRMNNYMVYYTDDYPPFHGRVLPHENQNIDGDSTADHLVEV